MENPHSNSDLAHRLRTAEQKSDALTGLVHDYREYLSLEQRGLLIEASGALSAIRLGIVESDPRISDNLITVLRLWDNHPPSVPSEKLEQLVLNLCGTIGVTASLGFTADSQRGNHFGKSPRSKN